MSFRNRPSMFHGESTAAADSHKKDPSLQVHREGGRPNETFGTGIAD